jgi:hypothetical protein
MQKIIDAVIKLTALRSIPLEQCLINLPWTTQLGVTSQ